MEQFTKQYSHIKFLSCHPGWVDTPGVESAYGFKFLFKLIYRTIKKISRANEKFMGRM